MLKETHPGLAVMQTDHHFVHVAPRESAGVGASMAQEDCARIERERAGGASGSQGGAVQIKFQALFSLVAFEDIDALQDASRLLHARSARMLFASVSIELDGAGEQREQEPRQTTSGERTSELNGTVTYELRRPVLPIFHDTTASASRTTPTIRRQQREGRSCGGKAALAEALRLQKHESVSQSSGSRMHSKQPRAVRAHEPSTRSAVEEWLWSSPSSQHQSSTSSQHHTPQHALPLLALKINVKDGAVAGAHRGEGVSHSGGEEGGLVRVDECIEEFDSTESLGSLNYSHSSPSLTSSGEKKQVKETEDESEHAAQKEEARGKLEEKTGAWV